jgi:multiple sugar transport system permease protein
MSKTITKTILDIVAYAFLILGALTMLIPFVWMISVSLRLPAEQFSRSIIQPDHFPKLFRPF